MRNEHLIVAIVFCYAVLAGVIVASMTYAARRPIDVHRYVDEYIHPHR